MNEKRFNNIFSTCILAGMTVCVILSCIGKMQEPGARTALLIVSSFGALCGVASTVLSAGGNIWNFLFGLLDVSIYSYILFDSKMPAQFLLHILYILPMEFVGFFQWRKRGASGKKAVKAQRIKGKKGLNYAALFIGVYAVTFIVDYLLLKKAEGFVNPPKMILDAAVTTSNIVAFVMMAFAYMEQWYLWILVNVSSVVLWSITLISGGAEAGYAIIPLVKYVFYLINSLNGLRIWMGLSKES